MKYFFFFLAAAFAKATFAQPSFEGVITYSVRSSFVLHGSEQKDESSLVVHFGNNKMKIQFIEASKKGKKPAYKLIYLDSGKVYTVDPETHTYIYHRLSERKPGAGVPATKTIAGYETHSTSINGMDISGELSALLSPKTVFYVAEKLAYPVPEKYAGNAELLVVQNGKIVLGSDFYFSYNTFNFQVDEEEDKAVNQSNFAVIEAREILATKTDPNEFALSKEYKIRSRYDSNSNNSATKVDSMVIAIGSTLQNAPKTNRKKTKQKEKSQAPAGRQSALRRKEN